MKKYVVTVYEIHSVDIEVEAQDEDHARSIANVRIEESPYTVEYERTYDIDNWDVLELGEVK